MSSTESAATAASDATSKDAGAMRASGDGIADNQVDTPEVFGDFSNAAADKSADGTSASGGNAPSASGSGSGSASDGQSGGADSGNGGSSESGSGGSADNQGAGDADPGVKTEADGFTWTGYY